MDQDTIDAVADWRASDKLNEREKLVIEYSEALSTTPCTASDELREQLHANFSEKQIVELTNLITWENARARFNRAFDLQPEGYASDS